VKHDWGLDQPVEGELAQGLGPGLGLELGMTLDWGPDVVMAMWSQKSQALDLW